MFSVYQIISAADIRSYADLSEKYSYFFLNRSINHNGSSIYDSAKQKVFNSFWQAYKWYQTGNGLGLDLYTKLKIDHFLQGRKIVLQGIDLPEQYPDKPLMNSHVLNKVIKELWIKESVLQQRTISDLENLPGGSYKLIYVRKPEDLFFASTIHCEMSNGILHLKEQKNYDNEDELRFAFPILAHLEKLYDESFFLYDECADILLTAYTNIRVPQILGNTSFDNISRFAEDGNTLRKLSDNHVNPLPYYVSKRIRGQYHHIFMQETDTDLRYFVSAKGNPQSVFDKQRRVYNILAWDRQGVPAQQSTQAVTKTYLQSFTDDILLSNQVSKSSLLMKMARLFLEN